MNVEIGICRTVPFLGLFVSNFRYCVFAVRFVVSAKFGTCTVGSVNGTLVEDKMRRFKGQCAHISFNKCPPIYTHDGASAKFSNTVTHMKRKTVQEGLEKNYIDSGYLRMSKIEEEKKIIASFLIHTLQQRLLTLFEVQNVYKKD
jgi:hypothetical protein